MEYDRSTKTYVRSRKFKPKLIDPGASDYLNELRLVADGQRQVSWIGEAPPVGVLPAHARSVDWRRLRDILSAIRDGDSIEVLYQSFSRPDPEWRGIAPHALGFDGIRWHARAWCLRSETFKDFSLARIQGTRSPKPFALDRREDKDWLESIEITVVADPSLPAAQRRAIELEYGMRDGKLKIPVRRAFLIYALRRLGLDVPEDVRPIGSRRLKLLDRARIAAIAGIGGRETVRLATVL